VNPIVKHIHEEKICAINNALAELLFHMERNAPASDSSCSKGGSRPHIRRTVPLLDIEAKYLVFVATCQRNCPAQPDFPEDAAGELIRASIGKEIF